MGTLLRHFWEEATVNVDVTWVFRQQLYNVLEIPSVINKTYTHLFLLSMYVSF